MAPASQQVVWHGYDCRGSRGEYGFLYVANVGDSRVYLVPKFGPPSRSAAITLECARHWTRTHITAEAAKNHPNRGADRSLGNQPAVKPEISQAFRLSLVIR